MFDIAPLALSVFAQQKRIEGYEQHEDMIKQIMKLGKFRCLMKRTITIP